MLQRSSVQTATDRKSQLRTFSQSIPDFSGTMIRYKTSGYPSSPTDGALVVDKSGYPGGSSSHNHSGLINGTTCYYAAFAHDSVPNYASPADTMAVPTASVDADFDGDHDVDLEDFGHMQSCFSGNGVLYGAGCEDADLDDDLDVDLNDFGQFLDCMAGAKVAPSC